MVAKLGEKAISRELTQINTNNLPGVIRAAALRMKKRLETQQTASVRKEVLSIDRDNKESYQLL
jgi:hypothetical protein